MNSHHKTRTDRYFDLSNRLAHVDDRQLAALMSGEGPRQGWGGTHVFKLGPSKVFAKKIPVTKLEYDHLFSTENLYDLPTFYNYGVGSAGFGAFRELVAHIKTTNWVLEGSVANFPLMYHYRIVPSSGTPPEVDEERHGKYVKYWASNPSIDRYIRARHSATYEAVIFLEHFPDVLGPWLGKNTDQWEGVIREMQQTIAFLRLKGMIHFDVHFWNILIDRGIPYLADFGLALDKNFGLSGEEKQFFSRHTDYDHAEFLSGVGSHLHTIYRNLPERKKEKITRRYGFEEEKASGKQVALLLENIEKIHAEGLMPLDGYYVEQVIRHRSLMLLMTDFYTRMWGNDRKDTPYPHAKIRRLLKETGVL